MKSKQFAVIGIGHFGLSVARTLKQGGHEVLLIDNDEERVQAAMEQEAATEAVCLDATHLHALEELGLNHFDGVVIAIGEHLQESILTALNLLELGVRQIVAKASTPAHGKILQKLNVHRVVYPEQEMGERVARSLVQSHILDGFELDPRYSVIEVLAGEALYGHSLKELDLRARYGIYVMAIKSPGQELAIVPSPDRYIQEKDILLVLGANRQLERFIEVTNPRGT